MLRCSRGTAAAALYWLIFVSHVEDALRKEWLESVHWYLRKLQRSLYQAVTCRFVWTLHPTNWLRSSTISRHLRPLHCLNVGISCYKFIVLSEDEKSFGHQDLSVRITPPRVARAMSKNTLESCCQSLHQTCYLRSVDFILVHSFSVQNVDYTMLTSRSIQVVISLLTLASRTLDGLCHV